MRTALLTALLVVFGLLGARGQGIPEGSRAAGQAQSKVYIPWSDAAAVAVATWRDSLPESLQGLSVVEMESRWPEWVRQRDRDIRARLERGDEDSVVNLWLYGTTFTRWPRAVEPEMARLERGVSADALIAGRLEDLLDGMAQPGTNERLEVAREVLLRRGVDPAVPGGRERARRLLLQARDRMIDEFREYERRVQATARRGDPGETMSVHAILFRERGLSSDTSVLVDFAVDRALRAIASSGALAPGTVRNVGIVGPGLDLTNKADGHDFYPLQTIQPFAVMDALIGLGLGDGAGLRVATFDVSMRVNRHLAAARARAEAGAGYLLHFIRPIHADWRPELLAYVSAFGRHVGQLTSPARVPATAGGLSVSAVQIHPSRVLSIDPWDLNIVMERFAPLAAKDRFDLIIATNVFVYYSRFEQALAMSNVASMLRPGGILITNNAVFPVPPFTASAHHLRASYSDADGDDVFWYERK
jgi:SAM-dependent methyltransferase